MEEIKQEKNEEIKKGDGNLVTYIKNNSLQITLQVIGVGVLILNLWLTTKLAPLAQNLAILTNKVDALEITQDRSTTDHDAVLTIKTEVSQIKDNLAEMKSDIKVLLREK